MQISPMTWSDNIADFHAVVSIEFGELVYDGIVDWSDPSWKWNVYSDEQYERLTQKIENRFWNREISIIPPGLWKRQFIEKLNEIQPKYNILYNMLDQGINILQTDNEYFKGRDIYSDFPQTALNGQQDYASSGTDREYERVHDGDVLDNYLQFAREYDDVDVLMLNELEVLFSDLITVNLNGF